ncbi:MAG: protein-glutamate O-methyltransferase CheR [Clostridiaceae bacterium]|nr:protein-glutamate O-methyltransferase CheR [Clostridiaceae bacterium]
MIMDYEGFKKEVYNLSGIDLGSYKEKQMKRRLDSLIAKNGFDNYCQYVNALKEDRHLYNEFINYMTINVSEFYRNPEQWEKLKSIVLPILLKENKTLKIWSAACSSGDEPYTLVMILNEFLNLNNIKIIATDIDKEILVKAKNGVYNEKSVANLPEKYIEKYFKKEDNMYQITEEVKKCVEFRHHNLLSDPYPDNCDLIVCRNVLIYFTEEAKVEIYKKVSKSLKTEGILFVGSTEQIIMYTNYDLKSIQTFFYQKIDNTQNNK